MRAHRSLHVRTPFFPTPRSSDLEPLWDLGFLLGIGGPVTYERARRLRELVAGMPLEHLLLETDAPDQSDSAIRGQRNEPARLRPVCETIEELRGVPVEAISSATPGTAESLFGHMQPAPTPNNPWGSGGSSTQLPERRTATRLIP